VICILTNKSLSHTTARKEASKAGARIASMPTFEESMLPALDIDYDEMNILTNRLADLIDAGSTIRLVKDDGTDLSFSIKGRKGHGRSAGIIHKPGNYSNLPDGECFVAPVEGSANGMFIVDGSVAREGMVDKPMKVTVKDGFATALEGGTVAESLLKTLKSKGKNAFNIAEFGIGTNPKAKITGNLLEDEKVLGTIHIAFGNNTGFGGNTEVQLHIDCLVTKPTFFIDDKKIMDQGKFII
jgi:leucyl aminopeptidase (aminopeptidase T)